ncbi:MAG: restriction endonuclease subunit S [Planctomycetota bacterium]
MQKNENRPGYKKTKVGWIPEDWECRLYGDSFSTIMDGTHFSPKSTSGFRRYLTSRNVRKGFLDLNTCLYISDEEHEEIYKRCPVRFGQVLLTKDGANVGNACLNVLNEEFSLLSSVAVLDSDSTVLINRYAIQWILSARGQYGLLSAIAGQAITRITLEAIASVGISLPPFPEQKAIAGVLECWDKAIRNYEKKIEKKRNIKRGLMQRLLSGKQRLSGFSGEWKEARLGNIADILDNRRIPLNGEIRSSMEGNIPYYGANGILDYVNDYIFNEELVLVAEDGGHFDEYCSRPIAQLINGKAWVNNHAHVLRARNGENSFLFYSLVHRNILKYLNGGTRAKLNKSELISIKLSYPFIKEQKAIASVLSAADGEIEALERKLAILKDQKKFLLNNLVTGTIRLPQFRGGTTHTGADGDHA